MNTGTYLLAPMTLDALLVNTPVLQLPFRRWRQQYTQLNNYNSPIPAPFQGEIDPNFSGNDNNRGVYLHWQVPKSLKQGIADNPSNTPVFPHLPNRWLVVRFYGTGSARKAKGWILESDCPNDDVQNRAVDSSPYLMDPVILRLWAQSQSAPRRTVAQETVPDGNPQPDTVYNVLLGKVFDLATWTEQGIDQQFLTAMAPGNTEFISFQPMVANIFSFHDRVQNDPEVTEGTPLSYFIAGWYSVPGADPLAPLQRPNVKVSLFDDLLDSLQWELAGGKRSSAQLTAIPNQLITHGLVYNMVWQNATTPVDQIQNVTNLHAAIGNNAIDAFQNMVNQQLQDNAVGDAGLRGLLNSIPDASHLLEAFQYNLLYLLEQPGGNIVLQNAIRQQWFSPRAGGIRWTIVDDDTLALTTPDPVQQAAEIARETPWLVKLNQDQDTYDSLMRQLRRAQNDLFRVWWKYAYFQKNYNPFQGGNWGVTTDDFVKALYPGTLGPEGLIRPINRLLSQVQRQTALIPQPIYLKPDDTQEQALQNGINAFMDKQRAQGLLSASRILRSTVQPDFYAPNDPVLLLTGAHTQQTVLDPRLLPVRVVEQVVTAFIPKGSQARITAEALGGLLPGLDLSRLPSAVRPLYNEAFLLDPVNAPAVASKIPKPGNPDVEGVRQAMEAHLAENYAGIVPALILKDWQQPWNPLYFEWRLNYYPIPELDASGSPNWQFDGTDYHYVGAVPSNPTPFDVLGRCILTSQVTGVFERRLEEYLSSHPDPRIQAIVNELAVDHWDFLAQAFTGFNQALAQTLHANNRLDTTTTIESTKLHIPQITIAIASFIDGQTETLPMNISNPDLQPFQGIRRGQVAVAQMIVYDAFGQVLDVVTSSPGLRNADNFHPILGPELRPDKPIVAQNPWRFFQFAPRFIQPARLSFRLVDAVQPTQYVDIVETANPVAGWIIPNHLENGLSLYDARGTSLGNVRLTVGTDGNKRVSWQAAPHSAVQTLAQLAADAPLMGQWLSGLQAAGSVAFQDFLAAIDETLWTIDPLGGRGDQNLAVLIGRPLALTRAKLQFQLNGAPLRDQSYPKTFDTTVPTYIQEKYQIRLGEQELREDGLIGYYLDQNYGTFHNVHAPQGANSQYLSSIRPGNYISLSFDGQSTADVMLLLDPRAAVHAVTGLFPVLSLSLPNAFVDPFLSKLEISFHVAPYLTELVANPDPKTAANLPTAILIPTPAEQNGTWSWWELGAPLTAQPTYAQLALKQETGVADISSNDKSLRDGFLQLIIDVEP